MSNINIDVEFFQWFEREYSGDAQEGSKSHAQLQDAFEAGIRLGIVAGEEKQKDESIKTMRKFFETEFENCLDALEEIIR